jgi:hypothetical protein
VYLDHAKGVEEVAYVVYFEEVTEVEEAKRIG